MALVITKDAGNYGAVFPVQAVAKGNVRLLTGSVAFDSSYPTNGEAMDLSVYFPVALKGVLFEETTGYRFEYDYTAKKVKVYSKVAKPVILNFTRSVKGSANTDSENADQAAEPTNGHSIAAAAAVAAGAWAPGALTQPGTARNVGIVINNPTGGGLNLYEGAMKVTVTGTWRGAAQTEDITFTSTAGNKAVAAAKFRYKYGLKPFDTVTACVVDHVPADALTIAIGPGSSIGLPTDLLTPVEADVVKVSKQMLNIAVTGVVDTTNMTFKFGTLADSDIITIDYKAGYIADSTEIPNTTDLSALTAVRFLAWGY